MYILVYTILITWPVHYSISLVLSDINLVLGDKTFSVSLNCKFKNENILFKHNRLNNWDLIRNFVESDDFKI